ncbi:hypothetical protein CVT26_004839 [Gymnopilus dilepis]|uniref:Vacuolar calcium ion transporter n=1 Tax=Gymnopilus dilepis TaxID=231916 RepID=A0A409YTR8_9AGAR|nr:hypothetical protein CVT26_004839 [Gymnopilus dilepis]
MSALAEELAAGRTNEPLMRVYLVRHGETQENRDGIIQGHKNTVLNETGQEQARIVGERFRETKIDILYTSDLTRARSTAEAILAHHPEVRAEEYKEIRERGFGDLEGTIYGPNTKLVMASDPTIEPNASFNSRIVGWWNERILGHALSKAKDNGPMTVVVTTHGGVIRTLAAFIKAEGEPSWIQSYRWFLFGNYFNVLLVFVPLSAFAHYLHWDVSLRFSFSFLAIMPLAKLLGDSTEQMSARLGQTLAGLLNASFGNAVEIIVGIAALLQDELRIVQTSMLGSILSNILLVLGCSFVAGGLKRLESHFKATAAQASSSLMTLACITLVIPAAYQSARGESDGNEGLLIISRGTAIILLLVYVAYIYFQLKLQDGLSDSVENGSPSAVTPQEEGEEAKMSVAAASVSLLIVTVVTSFCADYLVASIGEFAERYHVPKAFIGLILLPIVANAAEHVTSVWMAFEDKMDLTMTISVGSSIQIASFVVPLLVIVGWISGHELTLYFANFETIVLFASVLLVNTLIQDGKSNYMEGLMLVSLYLVISLACTTLFFASAHMNPG